MLVAVLTWMTLALLVVAVVMATMMMSRASNIRHITALTAAKDPVPTCSYDLTLTLTD